MASEFEKTKNALSDLECLRAISVQNLPSDVTKQLLQCLFPEASEIKLTVDRDGKYKWRSSIVIFPKVSNALYYADQDRTIKLDHNILSIQSLVHDTTSSSDRKKRASSPNSDNREKDRGHQDKDQPYGTPSDNNRSSKQHMSSHGSYRSLSPSHISKHGHDLSGRSFLHQDDHSSRSLSHREDHDRRVMLHLDDHIGKPPSRQDDHIGRPPHRNDHIGRPPPHRDDHIGRPPSRRDDHISRPNLHRDIRHSPHWDDHESRSSHQDKHSHFQSTRHEKYFSRSTDGNKILVKNLPRSVSKPSIFSLIPNAKEVTIHNDKSRRDSIISVVEFYTDKEAEAFLRQKNPIFLGRHALIIEPYATERADSERNIYLRTRSQSPELRQRNSSPRIRQRSRSPLIRHHSPPIQHHSSSGRDHSPQSHRRSLIHKSGVHQNDRLHFIAPFAMQKQNIKKDQLHQPNKDVRDGGRGGMGADRRFVSITSRVNEQFNSQQSGRYVEIAPHEEQSTDIFSQFKNHAKKFATENPNSARALNELLVALGNTNQPNLKCSPLDDLQKAFNPEDRLHCDLWSSDFKRSRDDRNFERKDLLDYPKLSSVLEQVKDLSKNLGILSQLSQLAKHLKTDSNDSNVAASMALSSLEKLVSKTTDALSDNSRKPSQSHDMDEHFSPYPNDSYYKTVESADFQDDPKYMSIDYNHQKAADEIDRPSLYQKENYHHDLYDDTYDYKDQHRPDYDLDSQLGYTRKSNYRQYDERFQTYDEPFNDDWYENPDRRNQSEPCNPRQFDHMNQNYHFQSDGYDLDKSQHSRFGHMSGGLGQYQHHSDDLHQDMSQMDGENYPHDLPPDDDNDDKNKPLGWRYYSLGMKTCKYK